MSDKPKYTSERPATLSDVREAARKVVERVPEDYTYPAAELSCYYVGSAHPLYPGSTNLPEWFKAEHAESIKARYETDAGKNVGCIVGEVIKELGLMNDSLAKSRAAARHAIPSAEIPIESWDALKYLNNLQVRQDVGKTWHSAFNDAEALCNNPYS